MSASTVSVGVTQADLRDMLPLAKQRGTLDAWCEVALQWMDGAGQKIAADAVKLAALKSAAEGAEAFIGVMYGDRDGVVPEHISTPIGVPLKLRDLQTILLNAIKDAP